MMKLGDVINERDLPDAMNALPERAVAVCHRGDDYNVAIRTADGFDWYRKGRVNRHSRGIWAGEWTVVYLPPAPALKVGDVIETEEQCDALPVGSVVIDPDDIPHSQACVKTSSGLWRYFDEEGAALATGWVEGRVVHIPGVAA